MTESTTAPLALGVDLGGTSTVCALVAQTGEILATQQAPTPAQRGGEAVVATALSVAEQTADCAEGRERVAAVGIAAPGPVDFDRGELRSDPGNIPGLKQQPLRRRFQQQFDVPVFLENDVNAACYGEWRCGAGRGARILACVTLGTGVGGAFIADGRLHRGASCYAGEVGHIILQAGGPECWCGGRGCFEALAGLRGIARLARQAAAEHPDSLLAVPPASPDDVSVVRGLFAAAEQGDGVAQQVVDRVAQYVALGLGSLMHVLDPDRVLLGGGTSQAGETLWAPLRRHLEAERLRRPWCQTEVLPTALGANSGVVGAAILALDSA
ncbi:MAG: ROK family protein, partial [Armatimonadota bacterium]